MCWPTKYLIRSHHKENTQSCIWFILSFQRVWDLFGWLKFSGTGNITFFSSTCPEVKTTLTCLSKNSSILSFIPIWICIENSQPCSCSVHVYKLSVCSRVKIIIIFFKFSFEDLEEMLVFKRAHWLLWFENTFFSLSFKQ